MKIWTQSCRFSLRTRKSSKTSKFSCFFIFFIFVSFVFHVFIIFFHFPCPWHLKSRKAMKNNGKPSKTKENEKKNEVANEKKMKIWTQSCRFSLRTRKSSKTRGNVHVFFHFFIFLSCFFHFPCPWHLKSRKAMKDNEKQWKTIKNKGK